MKKSNDVISTRRPLAIARVVIPLLMAGCVAQGPEECPVCRITLSYTLNTEGRERLSELVDGIRLYAFDAQTDILRATIDVDGKTIARGRVDLDDLDDGSYTLVAWGFGGGAGGAGGAGLTRTFSEGHMIDAEHHIHTRVTVGQTTLDDLYMMLLSEILPAGRGPGEVVPATGAPGELFFARAEDVTIAGGTMRRVALEFVRNTTLLSVTVSGIEHLPGYDPATRATAAEVPLTLFAVGENGRYRHDNTIDEHAPAVRYDPCEQTLADGVSLHTTTGTTSTTSGTTGTTTELRSSIRTLRLDLDRHGSTDPVLLYVRDAEDHNLVPPIDVVKAIRQSRGTQGEYLYPDQMSIDRVYEFPFRVVIGSDLSVRILIHDWEFIDLTAIQ